MSNKDLIARICAFADSHKADHEAYNTGVAGLLTLRSYKRTSMEAVLYTPLLCLILQGRKETFTGVHSRSFGENQSLIVSHDMPVVSRVIEASKTKPYVAMVLPLDMSIVRNLYNEVGEVEIEDRSSGAVNIGETDPHVVDAMGRLFDLVDRPFEAKVMAPLIQREIHFRLLIAQHGGMLRQLLKRGSYANRLEKVIARIKQNYATPLTVAELASTAGMSISSFHQHFKMLTATTPLQYQKDLRLLEARRLLMDCGHTVSSAAFEVGYESPTQFSREYARKFNHSPSADKTSMALT